MGLVIFILLIGVPIAELYVIVQVAQGIGVLYTLALLFTVSVAGAWLLKQQGLATWRRLQTTLARGEMPTNEVSDGALILLGGALLLTPGFLTDAVGLVLLLPPTRAALKGATRKLFRGWAERKVAPGRAVYDAVVVRDVTRRPERSPLPESPDLADGDDSPDRA